MRRRAVAVAVASAFAALAAGGPARAHRIDEYLQATLVTIGVDRLDAELRLVPGATIAASVVADIDQDGDGSLSPVEERTYAERVLADQTIEIDGRTVRPRLVGWQFPPPRELQDGEGAIRIDYSIDVTPKAGERTVALANRHRAAASVYLMNVLAPRDPRLHVLRQHRDRRQSTHTMVYRQDAAAGRAETDDASPAVFFRLGMRHIAEGPDHLLFLLMLLLPAPLVASGGRWRGTLEPRRGLWKAAAIVTGFTVGHSLTLAVTALAGPLVPSRPVEVLIAASILVSAMHAWRPLFAGREPAVAASFGLVHGMAFAATLDLLGATGWHRIADLLAFNLGIEAVQLLVVAAVLPSLCLLSRHRGYRPLRTIGAALAGTVSIAWIVERAWDLRTPVDAMVDACVRQAGWIAALLFVTSLAVARTTGRKPGREDRS